MIDLILSILSATAILIMFKVLEHRKIRLLLPIIINYLTATGLGLGLTFGNSGTAGIFKAPWLFMALIIGILLICLFWVIGLSTQKAGMAVTTISTRMSVIIPMAFSICWLNEDLNLLKAGGMAMGLAALALSGRKGPKTNLNFFFLPLILFLGIGILDSLVKFTQHFLLQEGDFAFFTGACFFFAFAAGFLICMVKGVGLKPFFQPGILISGLVLGCVNFGSIFFLIRALEKDAFDASILFGLNSVGIVCLSVFAAAILFKEKLTRANWTGVGLAVLAILTLTRA